MDIDSKKEHIMRCIDLGMDFFKSCLSSGCTDEEIEKLELDESFQKQVEIKYSLAEYNLLMKHNTALEVAKMKGNATPIQWRLDKLNPKKYGNKTSLDVNSKGKLDLFSFDIPLEKKQEIAYKQRMKDVFGEEFVEKE